MLVGEFVVTYSSEPWVGSFIVRVFSPELIQDKTLYFLGMKNLKVHRVDQVTKIPEKGEGNEISNFEMDFLDLHLEMINSYQSVPAKKRGYLERR